MAELGRRGGLKRPETELRKAVKQDEEIRAQAQDVIRRGLAGDESVTKTMLDAARSVFSFRAASPPEDRRADAADGVPLNEDGTGPTSLADVLWFGFTANESTRRMIEESIREACSRAGVPAVFEESRSSATPGTTRTRRVLAR